MAKEFILTLHFALVIMLAMDNLHVVIILFVIVIPMNAINAYQLVIHKFVVVIQLVMVMRRVAKNAMAELFKGI
jgi:hypothetical protein